MQVRTAAARCSAMVCGDGGFTAGVEVDVDVGVVLVLGSMQARTAAARCSAVCMVTFTPGVEVEVEVDVDVELELS